MPRLAAEGGLDRDLGLTLEVGAPHDDRAGIALYRRHIYEGKGAAISAGVLASAAHAAFGVVMELPADPKCRRAHLQHHESKE